MRAILEFLNSYTIWGINTLNWALFAAFSVCFFAFFWLGTTRFTLPWIKKIADQTVNKIDDVVYRTAKRSKWLLFAILELYVVRFFLPLDEPILNILNRIILVFAIGIAVLVSFQTVDYFNQRMVKNNNQLTQNVGLVKFISRIIKVFLVGIALILILANLGYDVNSLVAGLGIGGIAIAFAVQNVLEDIFGSLSIHFDQPFAVGDLIKFQDKLGYVQDIGIRTTRINLLKQGQKLIVPNKILANNAIENFKTMPQRRVEFSLQIKPTTNTSKLRTLNDKIETLIGNTENATFVRCNLIVLGDYSFNYEIVYLVGSNEFLMYAKAQEAINLGLIELVNTEGLELAFPTSVVLNE